MNVPTPETITDWDDASLFTVLGCSAATRASHSGFISLNESERVLCCVYDLVSEVNNGGFGQWLFHCNPEVIAHTGWACQRISAYLMYQLIEVVLGQLDHPMTSMSINAWHNYLHELPQEKHVAFETYSTPYASAECELLDRSYEFARQYWFDVRTS